ncbi:protein argonaute-2-like [Tropilaelaps mercedesae]|uniref:Protein argonaute-2-like n=1 Tax=Tropilaelaps mercedesae TaxID=418985 RepID=A0A1V9XV56_9ACAR|nr:protein argonaute-2-like [Tropilaelaps mercedesae]
MEVFEVEAAGVEKNMKAIEAAVAVNVLLAMVAVEVTLTALKLGAVERRTSWKNQIFGTGPKCREHRRTYENQLLAYDGKQRACCLRKLANDELQYTVEYDDDNWLIELAYEKVVSLIGAKPNKNFTKKENFDESLLSLAIMLNHMPSLSYTPLGKGLYGLPEEKPVIIGGGFELWTGYGADVLPDEEKLFWNVNKTIATFIRPGMLTDRVQELIGAYELSKFLTSNQIADLDKKLTRCKFQATHLKFNEIFTKQGRETGIELAPPVLDHREYPTISDRLLIEVIEARITNIVNENRLDFVLFVIGDNNAVHAAIKFTCDVTLAVSSKCVKSQTVWKAVNNNRSGRDQCILNIKGWTDFPKTPSTVGIVGTRNMNATPYTGIMSAQRKPVDNADRDVIQPSSLKPAIKALLKIFYENNGRRPERIIVYRDGVSNGQFSAVLTTEMKAIIEAAEFAQFNWHRRPEFQDCEHQNYFFGGSG